MNAPSGREKSVASESSSGVRDPVELLAEEFLDRRRRGERPTVEDYAARHPELADAIRDLFPALVMMEDVGAGSLGVPSSTADRNAATSDASRSGGREHPAPDRLGDYRILGEIGRGAMGVVYEAEQGSLNRRVALKVLPAQALANPMQVRRFEREARAAGRLHHTNIVPVFGVGIEGHTHYYVMQFIQGQPLSDVIAELRRLRREAGSGSPAVAKESKNATPTAADVARSLWHGAFAPAEATSTDALPPTVTEAGPTPASATRSDPGAPSSPSNALLRSSAPAHSNWRYARTVARLGAQAAEALDYAAQQGVLHRDVKPSNLLLDIHGTLWVTDFGLAKLADHEDLTRTGDLLGTLRYMAPERFRGQADVRSDVYGLGLTLYELLALRPAYEETERASLIDQLTRAEPPRLLKLDPAIPRDLATIVHKAIARDPSDRYQTAGDLASDLTRFLEDRPIRARRLSPVGVAWRWARRNKAVAALLGLVAVLLVGITAISTTAAERYRDVAKRADQARGAADAATKQAVARRKESEASAARALAARTEADQSAAESKAVVDFMVNQVLGAAAPSRTRGEAMTVLQALEQADKAVEGEFGEQPRVEASVRLALALIYRELGEYERAIGHAERALALRERALGPEHEETAEAMDVLGWALIYSNTHSKTPAQDVRGEVLFRRMLEICRAKGYYELRLKAMSGLASILGRLQRPEEALRLQEEVLKHRIESSGPSHWSTLTAKNNLAIALLEAGRLKEAELLLREVAEHRLREQPDALITLTTMSNYVILLQRLGRFEEAGVWALRSMDAHLRVLKFNHPDTLHIIQVAIALTTGDDWVERRLKILDPTLERARREIGPDDRRTLALLWQRIPLLYTRGDLSGAAAGAAELVEAHSRTLGPDAPETLDALIRLAAIRRDLGEVADARALLDRFRRSASRALDPGREEPLPGPAALSVRRLATFAEVLARSLDRPGRSDVAPGEPGGPPRIDAPLQATSPVADGRIAPGEYADGEGFAYDFATKDNPGLSYLFDETTPETKDPSDLAVRLHAAHTGESLFLAFRVRDQFMRAEPVAANAPFLNDSVEVFLDGDRAANDHTVSVFHGNPEGFQFVADSLGNRVCSAFRIGLDSWKAVAGRTEDGYVIEFEVPLKLIDTEDGPGVAPAATGSELRMNVGVTDIDEAINKQTFYGMLWSESRLWSPMMGGEDFWPVALRLTSAP
jgi:serine/threonine protein kinase